MLTFGQLWLVHELTESPLFLGFVGVATAVPAIALNLFGGVFADRLDKRRLIMVTQALSALIIFLLATLTVLELVEVWHVLAIAFVTGAVNAFDQPARQALYPHLIDRKVMMSAVAMNSSIWQGTRIAAPAAAGIIIAVTGTAMTFFLAGLGFIIMAAPPNTSQALTCMILPSPPSPDFQILLCTVQGSRRMVREFCSRIYLDQRARCVSRAVSHQTLLH